MPRGRYWIGDVSLRQRFGLFLPSSYSYRVTGKWGAWIPIWLPFLIVAIPTAILWRRDRGLPPGHCQRCGYDLTGTSRAIDRSRSPRR